MAAKRTSRRPIRRACVDRWVRGARLRAIDRVSALATAKNSTTIGRRVQHRNYWSWHMDQVTRPRVVLILTTVPSDVLGEQIATALVSERLAACVHVGSPMTSIYRWKGSVE